MKSKRIALRIFTNPLLFLLVAFFPVKLQAQNMHLALEGAEWKDFNSHPVKGRSGILINQKLSFAEYYTADLDRSWTKGSSLTTGLSSGIPTDQDYRRIITKEYLKKNQTLYFLLKDSAGLAAETYCVSDFKAQEFTIGDNPVSVVNILTDIAGIGDKSASLFYVQIYTDGSGGPWHLVLDNEMVERDPQNYQGKLVRDSDEYYSIRPASKVKNKKGKVATMPFGSAGFHILNKSGEPVAAVSLIDKGVVYLKDLPSPERILLSSACAALLLREEI